MTPVEVLKSARELLSDEKRWTKYHAGRTELGVSADPCDRDAVRWCASGATRRVVGWNNTDAITLDAARRQLRNVIGDSITSWNDYSRRTHAEVLAAFDKAIALAEREAS